MKRSEEDSLISCVGCRKTYFSSAVASGASGIETLTKRPRESSDTYYSTQSAESWIFGSSCKKEAAAERGQRSCSATEAPFRP